MRGRPAAAGSPLVMLVFALRACAGAAGSAAETPEPALPTRDGEEPLVVGEYPKWIDDLKAENFELLRQAKWEEDEKEDAIILATSWGYVAALEVLLEIGANFNSTSSGWGALHLAALRENVPVVEWLLAQTPQDLRARNRVGQRHSGRDWTVALLAAARGHVPVLRVLQNEDARVLADVDASGATGAHLAAMRGHTKTLRFFMESGEPSDINARDASGRTALHAAASGGCVECIGLLEGYGADLARSTNDASTAAHLAAFEGHVAVLDELLARGAPLAEVDGDGRAIAHIAAAAGHADFVDRAMQISSG